MNAILVCCIEAGIFVGSLYVLKPSPPPGTLPRSRDHPDEVKARMIRTGMAATINLLITASMIDDRRLLGLGLWYAPLAALAGLCCVVLLYLGPISLEAFYALRGLRDPFERLKMLHDVTVVRDILVGPLVEEVAFRAAMVPLLHEAGYSYSAILAICAVIFGLAHCHHLIEHVRVNQLEWKQAAGLVAFQLLYTTIFGTISTHLFFRTGSLFAPLLAHMFCNYLGFPDFEDIFSNQRKYTTITFTFVGAWLFIVAMVALDPSPFRSPFFFAPLPPTPDIPSAFIPPKDLR
mmetsp:Transcript_47931/g.124454  ORF Transcript_47931/g.124454 Transcript_47931/m.124454 type:complete len:291 (-) Transcript_47931:1511-2383(-)